MKTATMRQPVTLNEIKQFLNPEKIAIAGVSRNPKKFGHIVLKELVDRGFDVYPVNPDADTIRGHRCYHSVTDLPDDVKHLLIVTPKHQTHAVADDAVSKGIKMVWIQQMSDSPEAIKILSDAGIPYISGKCILMFADPVKGPHKFHRFLVKITGRFPKTA